MSWHVYFAVCKLFRAWNQFINFNLWPIHKSTEGTGHWEVALTNAGGWLIHCPGFNVSKFLSNRTASDDHIPHLGRLEYLVVQRTLKIDYGFFFWRMEGNKMAKNKLSKTGVVPVHSALLTLPLIPLLAFLRNRAIIFPFRPFAPIETDVFSLLIGCHWANSFLSHYLGIARIILKGELEAKNSLAPRKSVVYNRYFVLIQKQRNWFYSSQVFLYLKIYTVINVIGHYILIQRLELP